jgi:phenylacetic acid degradation operon negative regulatory protein
VTDAVMPPEPVQPQDLALTLLGAYVLPAPREVWSGGLVELLSEFGFSSAAARVALSRLVNRGLLERVREGRLVHYALSARSERLLRDGDRRIFSLGGETWDGRWTVLWHWIPEERRLERARLGRRLRFLGFGPVQDGTWISPHARQAEVEALLTELEVTEHAAVLVGTPGGDDRMRALMERVWDLEELEARHRAFLDAFEPYASASAHEPLDERAAFLVRTSVVHWYRRFPFLDPGLPAGDSSARARASKVFHEVYESLAGPAQRHFDELTDPSRPALTSTVPDPAPAQPVL